MIDPAAPPDLSNSAILSVQLDGKRVDERDLFWNRLLLVVVREACKRFPKEDVKAMMSFRVKAGRTPGRGYEYVEELGLSINGMNANSAWQATYQMLRQTEISAEVEFGWPTRSTGRAKIIVKKSLPAL